MKGLARYVIESTMNNRLVATFKEQKWQRKFVKMRRSEEGVEDCFSWLHKWWLAPTSITTGIYELYLQLVPT